jgi:LmbE family N-acetylglucosaminyl deacetylase
VLCLGAHADDLEIGCGGTVLTLAESGRPLAITWVVWSAEGVRQREARDSADVFLARAKTRDVEVKSFRDGFFPSQGREIKEEFEALKQRVSPDVIFTHYRNDLHQDHRLISDLTWNTFRHHLVLEYEIPKYDGDLGSPNFFCVLPAPTLDRKVALLQRHYPSQASKPWFKADLFRAMARIRGMESSAPDGFSEGFYCRKARF